MKAITNYESRGVRAIFGIVQSAEILRYNRYDLTPSEAENQKGGKQ